MNSVTITLNEDGSYTVESPEPYMEPDEGSMEDMQEDMQEGAQTFATAEEACQAAIQMLAPTSDQPMIEGEDTLDFEKGFAGIRGE